MYDVRRRGAGLVVVVWLVDTRPNMRSPRTSWVTCGSIVLPLWVEERALFDRLLPHYFPCDDVFSDAVLIFENRRICHISFFASCIWWRSLGGMVISNILVVRTRVTVRYQELYILCTRSSTDFYLILFPETSRRLPGRPRSFLLATRLVWWYCMYYNMWCSVNLWEFFLRIYGGVCSFFTKPHFFNRTNKRSCSTDVYYVPPSFPRNEKKTPRTFYSYSNREAVRQTSTSFFSPRAY
jgi:hypothetical protein